MRRTSSTRCCGWKLHPPRKATRSAALFVLVVNLYLSILIDRDGDPKLRGACKEGRRGTFGGGGGLHAGTVRSRGSEPGDAGSSDGARSPLRAAHLPLAQSIHPSHQVVPG